MIRVLHIIDSMRGGGKERQFVELLKGFKTRKDFVNDVVMMSDVVDYREFHELDIRAHRIIRHTRYDPGVFVRLYRLLRVLRPDIVQSWNPMCTVYAAPVARLCGAKFVDGSVRAAMPSLSLRDMEYLAVKLAMPLSDAIVSNSLAGLAAYDVPRSKGLCIVNGFDPGRIAQLADPAQLKRDIGIAVPQIVGMVATYSSFKDYDTFFAIASKLTRTRADVAFVTIGDGENLEAYRARYPQSEFPNIRILGRRTDVESLVQLFTVGVLFSTRGEGIANSIMEYMALGKPVVATNCGGNRELVVDGKTGFLVPDADAEAAAHRIESLLDDRALARALGDCGRQRIREEFSMEKMMSAYEALYRKLAAA